MPPELVVFLITAGCLGAAYLVAYPMLRPLTATRIVKADILVTLALLVGVGLIYAGEGHGFSLILFDVPWWAFTLVVMGVLETPLFVWFARRHGLSVWDDFSGE